MFHFLPGGNIMKKILIIMILATIFIPISQTGASMGNKDMAYESKSQIMTKQVSDDILSRVSFNAPEKVKKEERAEKSTFKMQKSAKKRISSERKDRLVGLLLLAYGGQR